MSRRMLAMLVLALSYAAGGPIALAQTETPPADTIAAHTKLLELGYPPEPVRAIARWRNDTGRKGTGPMSTAEAAAILAQPLPKYFAALAGNPFQGMGVGIRHPDRWSAEAQAVVICKQRGGGKVCENTHIAAGKQCVFIAGYRLPKGDQRRSHGSFVIGTGGIPFVRAKAMESCRKTGAVPSLCKPILSFCADGSGFREFQSGGA